MMNLRTYLVQRVSAAIMAPLVLIHLIVIVYAMQGGLTADEILARTQGNYYWASFYSLFVLTAGVHAAIGIRTILFEWPPGVRLRDEVQHADHGSESDACAHQH